VARRVVTAPAAARGLRDAHRWLTQPGAGPVGRAKWENIRAARRWLRDWPYAGAESPEHPGCRALIAEGWQIVYQLTPDTGDGATAGDVMILAVFPPGIGERSLG